MLLQNKFKMPCGRGAPSRKPLGNLLPDQVARSASALLVGGSSAPNRRPRSVEVTIDT